MTKLTRHFALRSEPGSWVLRLVSLVLCFVLISRTLSRGDDFLVFYRVAQGFWEGKTPYDVSIYGNMVFKYPPWILPFFLPFGFLPVTLAKIAWGVVQALSLLFVIARLDGRYQIAPRLQTLFLLVFFGVIGIHGLVGQVTLSMLALALAIDPISASLSRFSWLAWAFSTKVLTLFPLVQGLRRKDLIRAAVFVLAIFSALSLPLLAKSYGFDVRALIGDWLHSMFSGTEAVNSVRIGFTTREAQGLPSLLLRKLSLDEANRTHLLACIFASFAAVTGFWVWRSRKLSLADQWLGWVALTPVVQPLAWFHFYIFAYPLIVVGANRAWIRRDIPVFSLYLASAFLIGAITEKTMGEVGLALEMWSVKSWGVLLAVTVFSAYAYRFPKAGLSVGKADS